MSEERVYVDLIQTGPDSDDEWVIESEPLVNLMTFGWLEDGRCGYPAEDQNSQNCPRPVPSLRNEPTNKHKFIAYRVAAGSRHSLLITVDCMSTKVTPKTLVDEYGFEYEEEVVRLARKRRLMITGLNQVALCEEAGNETFTDVDWDCEADPPETVAAGRGTSFFTTKSGKVVSFGFGKFGCLGHQDQETNQIPRIVRTLQKTAIRKVAAGCGNHVIALTENLDLFSWGRNHKGQLGRGFESDFELRPGPITFTGISKFTVRDVSVGENHSIAVIDTVGFSGAITGILYAWGDESRGQLGSGDASLRMRPQENRWLTKYLRKHRLTLGKIAAGGSHNLVLTSLGGLVISWGAGDCGQLGNGVQWDEPYPKMISGLKDVDEVAAGLRHSMCVRRSHAIEVYAWGYNGYGELGLGDTYIRLQPTKVTAIKNTQVQKIVCGDRHSIILSSYKPLTAREDLTLKPYFKILQNENNNRLILRRLKKNMAAVGMDPDLLDDPDAILPNQAGSNDEPLKNDLYEKGLRYCMDTVKNEDDWRRKALECCYEVHTKTLTLKSVCLACARNCLHMFRLKPLIRFRQSTDKCDCRLSGMCVCRWNSIRSFFDLVSDDDKCIGPEQVRQLLKSIRSPYPVDNADVEDCCIALCQGRDSGREPRVHPIPFERWYRKYYDEEEKENTEGL